MENFEETNKLSGFEYKGIYKDMAAKKWLRRNHVVFNLLPEMKRIEAIEKDPAKKITALGCLDYLGEDADAASGAFLPQVIALFVGCIALVGFLFSQVQKVSEAQGAVIGVAGNGVEESARRTLDIVSDNLENALVIFTIFGVAIVVTLLGLLVMQICRYRSSCVAAWATAWAKAIREFKPAPNGRGTAEGGSVHERGGDLEQR